MQGSPVTAVNAVTAWLIIQVIDVVSERLILPDWLNAIVIGRSAL